jgi:fibronectin-binding autotransporter adhesin
MASPRDQSAAAGLAVAVWALALGLAARAADVIKADNELSLATGASWRLGSPPTTTGVGVWNSLVTRPTSLDLGGNLSWQGLRLADPAGDVTIGGTGGLTLGAAGLDTGNQVDLTYRSSGTLDLNGPLAGSSSLTIAGPSTHNWSGMTSVSFTGGLALRGGAAPAGSFSGNWVGFGAATVTQSGGFSLDTGAALNDRGEFIVTDGWGDGIAKPKLRLTSLTGFGDLRSDWGSNSIRTLLVDQETDTVFQGRIISNAYDIRAINLEKAGSGRLTLSRGSSINATSVTAGTLTVADGGNLGGGRPLSVAAAATFDWARDGTFSSPISGSGRIVRSTTSGNALFSGDNSGFTGEWLVSAGRLGLVDDASLGAAMVGITLDGGGIYLLTNDGSIAASRTITLAAGGGTLDGFAGNSQTFAARLTGPGALRKAGGARAILTATNDFSGGTTIAAGTLVAAGSRALGAGAVMVEAGGRLELADGAAPRLAGLEISGGLVEIGSGELVIAAGGITAPTLRAELIGGRNGGGWNGPTGITSQAAADSGGTLAVGYRVESDGAARVAVAAPGDVDLGGVVDVFDLVAIGAAGRYGTGQSAGWQEGDFNYDGVTNVFDLLGIRLGAASAASLVGHADPATAVALPGGSIAAVPEPAAWRLPAGLAAAAMAVSQWRIRRGRGPGGAR